MRPRHGGDLAAFRRRFRPFDAGPGLRPGALAQGRPERSEAKSKDDEVGATGFARGDPLEEGPVFDFSSNVNPFGPPSWIGSVVQSSLREVSSYPDPHCTRLRSLLARFHGLPCENILVTNGATEGVHLALKGLAPKVALVIEPTNLEYRYAMNLYGVEVRNILLREKLNFKYVMAEILNALEGIDVLFLANPSSPTASEFNEEEVRLILKEAKARGIFVVIDETHADWTPWLSCVKFLKEGQFKFLVLRSVGKFYALPGLRLGYVIGPSPVVERLASVQLDRAISAVAQTVGCEAIQDVSFADDSRKRMAEERAWLMQTFSAMKPLKLYPSRTNFFLVKLLGSKSVSDIASALAKRHILIRDCVHYPGLDNHFFRLSVKTHEENVTFIETLRSLFSEKELQRV